MPGSLRTPELSYQNCFVKLAFSIGQIFILCGCSFFAIAVSNADEFQTVIKQAEVKLLDDIYVLHAELDFPLSPASKEALLKGIALSWSIPVSIKQQRNLLWDKEVFSLNLHYQIRYYALLNIYRVKAEHNKQVSNFASLAAALNSIANLQAIPLLKKNRLSTENDYTVEFKVAFDRDDLPIPLRPMTYFDSQWFLSSEWFVCSLPK